MKVPVISFERNIQTDTIGFWNYVDSLTTELNIKFNPVIMTYLDSNFKIEFSPISLDKASLILYFPLRVYFILSHQELKSLIYIFSAQNHKDSHFFNLYNLSDICGGKKNIITALAKKNLCEIHMPYDTMLFNANLYNQKNYFKNYLKLKQKIHFLSELEIKAVYSETKLQLQNLGVSLTIDENIFCKIVKDSFSNELNYLAVQPQIHKLEKQLIELSFHYLVGQLKMAV